jgi:adenylosuccinate synthase
LKNWALTQGRHLCFKKGAPDTSIPPDTGCSFRGFQGETRIGSTLKGIGPTYMDKTGRNGLRVGDIVLPDFIEKYNFLKNKHREILRHYDHRDDPENYEEEWFAGIERIKSFKLVDSEHFINRLIKEKTNDSCRRGPGNPA